MADNKSKSSTPRMTDEDELRYLRDSLLFFYESKVNFDKHKESFENVKEEFERDMDLYYDKYSNNNGEIRLKTNDMYPGVLGVKVKKVEPVNVVINAKKFIYACKDADIRKKAIITNYKIDDMMGLLKYLKSKGIRYSDVKSFITRVQTIDNDVVNQYVELGELDEEVVKSCADVKFKKPYYRFIPVRVKNPQRAVEV